jgi:hypothetical protein
VCSRLAHHASCVGCRCERRSHTSHTARSTPDSTPHRDKYTQTQILQQQHAPLLQLLGKTSGRDVDKVAALREAGVALHEEFGLPVLSGRVLVAQAPGAPCAA